jgi:hypothetical protein
LAKYKNGTMLGFSLARDGAAMIHIASNDWNIPEGDYPVTLSVDRTKPVEFVGRAAGTAIAMDWKLTETEINIVSSGVTLYATVGRMQFRYDLGGSRLMMQALLSCIKQRVQAANPFAGQAPVSREAASNPFQRM